MDHNIITLQGPIFSHPDKQRWIEFAGERVAIRVSGAETGGAFSVVEGILAPMSGPPLHTHENEDEAIQVLEGQLRIMINDKLFDAPAGSWVVIPRGVPHTWRNLTDKPARAVAVFTPGGAEQMFERFAGRPLEELPGIGAAFGCLFVGPPIAV